MPNGTSKEKRAEAIVTAAFHSDTEAAEKHDCSRRSIIRWRKQMDEDAELTRLVTEKYDELREEQDWIEDATRTIQQAFAFLRRAADELDPSDPEAVEAVAEAIQTITEAKLTAKVVNARLAENGRTRGAEADQNASGKLHPARRN